MSAIWRYTLQIDAEQDVAMPVGAQILCVQTQRERPQLWALVDPQATATERRSLRMYGAGQPFPTGEAERYIGTFQLRGGALVFHVFEVKP